MKAAAQPTTQNSGFLAQETGKVFTLCVRDQATPDFASTGIFLNTTSAVADDYLAFLQNVVQAVQSRARDALQAEAIRHGRTLQSQFGGVGSVAHQPSVGQSGQDASSGAGSGAVPPLSQSQARRIKHWLRQYFLRSPGAPMEPSGASIVWPSSARFIPLHKHCPACGYELSKKSPVGTPACDQRAAKVEQQTQNPWRTYQGFDKPTVGGNKGLAVVHPLAQADQGHAQRDASRGYGGIGRQQAGAGRNEDGEAAHHQDLVPVVHGDLRKGVLHRCLLALSALFSTRRV